ncbi:uncharacterized protein LOC128220243 isoform X2 [Mya arenaria]|uniref:uncharacterized protein LOC128220243 isoform X2 n=1 Tax=Mya arenaria TaxID=6604 RepID=UPI0022DFD4CD|nr:uncharacterized protein LOC128220243 isoform X2 [Mya arenaria]
MDEVPGKKLQTDASALETNHCQPCFQDGETLPAEAYCTFCKEFMCSNYTHVHRKQRITKSHTLLDKSSMPPTMQDFTIKEESTQPCDIHPEECIKYFCPTHQTLNCGHCSVLDHQSCKQQIISEIAKAFKEGQGYEAIKQIIVQLLRDTDVCVDNIKENIKLVEGFGEHEIANIRNYRDQINKYFDERENALLKIIAQMQSMNETLLDSLKSECDNLKIEVNKIKEELEAHENNNYQLFIEAHTAKNVLKKLQSTLVEINIKHSIHEYQFRKDPITEEVLGSKTGIGSIEETTTANALGWDGHTTSADSDIQATETTKTFSANTETESPLNPSGTQTSAKQKHEKQTTIRTGLAKLKYTPTAGILVKTSSNTSECWLTSLLELPGDRLLLADFNSITVELVDLNTCSLVDEFRVPTGLLDYETNTITRLDMNLNILQTFQDPALRGPTGITEVGNQLLICGGLSNNIMCLDLPSGLMTQLAGKKDGIESPNNVCYIQQQNKMYVTVDSFPNTNYVKVYETT